MDARIEWKPITTAPSGRTVLVYVPKYWVDSARGSTWPGSVASITAAELTIDDRGDPYWMLHDTETLSEPTLWAEMPDEPHATD
jgi:hypothetical protein